MDSTAQSIRRNKVYFYIVIVALLVGIHSKPVETIEQVRERFGEFMGSGK